MVATRVTARAVEKVNGGVETKIDRFVREWHRLERENNENDLARAVLVGKGRDEIGALRFARVLSIELEMSPGKIKTLLVAADAAAIVSDPKVWRAVGQRVAVMLAGVGAPEKRSAVERAFLAASELRGGPLSPKAALAILREQVPDLKEVKKPSQSEVVRERDLLVAEIKRLVKGKYLNHDVLSPEVAKIVGDA